jgi:large subunit ribosomal protein L14e
MEAKKMIEIGKLCIKIAGRDAGKKCVIVEILDDRFVMIDGETRRKRCNILHLEALDEKIDVKKGASHADVAEAFKKLGLEARETKPKEKKVRPRRLRRSKLATPASAEPKAKKAVKKIGTKVPNSQNKSSAKAAKTETKTVKKKATKKL